MKNNKTIILLDMDGVIVDFVGEVLKIFNLSNLYDTHKGEKIMIHEILKMNYLKFWEKIISHNPKFWEEIPKTQYCDQIIRALEDTVGLKNVCICTSQSKYRSGHCIDGKKKWIKQFLPEFSDRIIFSANKEYTAGPNKILIDDTERNTISFKQFGGKTILFPQPWNRLYDTHYNLFSKNPESIYEYMKKSINYQINTGS